MINNIFYRSHHKSFENFSHINYFIINFNYASSFISVFLKAIDVRNCKFIQKSEVIINSNIIINASLWWYDYQIINSQWVEYILNIKVAFWKYFHTDFDSIIMNNLNSSIFDSYSLYSQNLIYIRINERIRLYLSVKTASWNPVISHQSLRFWIKSFWRLSLSVWSIEGSDCNDHSIVFESLWKSTDNPFVINPLFRRYG